MLQSLHISNYALIDRVDIEFARGLNIITGETGAGKSIILGALSLLLGNRADTRTVSDPSRKSVIEAEFSLDGDYPLLKKYCLDNDIEWDSKQCLLRREIAATGGRSRAFVNDSPVPLARLSGVAMHLVDIHSQHQNQLLAQSAFQLAVIDSLAGNKERLSNYRQLFESLRNILRQLKATQARLIKGQEDEEYMRYQLEQIEALKLQPGEQHELERQREIISDISSVKENIRHILNALEGDGDSGARNLVEKARDAAAELGDILLTDIVSRLESISIEILDIARTVEDADERLQADPETLEYIEQRLNDIYSLQHKHHVDSVEQLIEIAGTLRKNLDEIDNGGEEIENLKKQARRAKALALESAAAISEARKKAADILCHEWQKRAIPLGMKNLRVAVTVSPSEMSSSGIDRVDYMFAFNKNQELTTVGNVASGGEISRLMLSLKSIIATTMQLPSIIFDEIDTGVSGDVANRMGQLMREMSKNLQVIAITHLPTVAAKGNAHFKVYKYDDESATHTSIKRLDTNSRIDELALMLSGDSTNPQARANATALLELE